MTVSRRIHASAALMIATLSFAAGCASAEAGEGDVRDHGGAEAATPLRRDETTKSAPLRGDETTKSAPLTEVAGDTRETAPAPPARPLWQPAELRDAEVQAAVAAVSRKYNLPRWFYYAVIHRESTFERCKVQDEGPAGDSLEDGRGVTQLSFGWYNGYPYPMGNAAPDDSDPRWRANMGLDTTFRGSIDMADVTPLAAPRFRGQSDCIAEKSSSGPADDAFDALANLERFSSGYAAPQYNLRRRLAPGDAPEVTLRKVAYHWHYGLWGSRSGDYPADPRPYLPAYDAYVAKYAPQVEAEDGAYTGPACSPPYAATGC